MAPRTSNLMALKKSQLVAALEAERELVANYQRKLVALDHKLREELTVEQIQRVSAQRGLVPYVRSLQALGEWLAERPALREQLEPILRELGLWDIKLGYDPDKDVSLSLMSPKQYPSENDLAPGETPAALDTISR